jgi:hypothetical protein
MSGSVRRCSSIAASMSSGINTIRRGMRSLMAARRSSAIGRWHR